MPDSKDILPILEFDPSPTAIIEPNRTKSHLKLPECCVMSFFGEVVEKYKNLPGTKHIGTSRWETGMVNFYQMSHRGKEVAFFHCWVGSPIVAGVLEVAIARGVQKVTLLSGQRSRIKK